MLLGIAITRAASVDATWTTVHLAWAALERGASVRFVEPWDYEVDARGQVTARAHAFEPGVASPEVLAAALRGRTAPRRYLRLDRLDLLLLRAVPFDMSLMAFACIAEDLGVPVVNRPSGLLRTSHKGWLASLPDVATPESLVTQSLGALHVFADRMEGPVVIKPAQGSGGRAVALVARGDGEGLELAFRAARGRGEYVVAQAYLPEAARGEKRLVWMDGEVLGGYLRTRAPGEFRHNLKRGGTPERTKITPAERAVVAPLGRHLLRCGIRLVGIDLIGEHIIEVNALNPGGAYHADRLHGTDITGSIVDGLLSSGPRDGSRGNRWVRPAP